MLCELFGGAGGNEGAAKGPCAGAEVDEVVGGAEDVEVMLDDDDGVSFAHKGLEDGEEFGDVVGVKADGGFVEEVEGFSGVSFGEFAGEADPSSFSSGEGLDFLPEGEVAEPDGDEGFEAILEFRDRREEGGGFFDGEA